MIKVDMLVERKEIRKAERLVVMSEHWQAVEKVAKQAVMLENSWECSRVVMKVMYWGTLKGACLALTLVAQ
jgi:hypothetical protein